MDARKSLPVLDWERLFTVAHSMAGDVKIVVRGVEYTVLSVDTLMDDTDRLHHWEVGLV